MDRSAHFEAFHRNGYTVIENFFPLPLLERFETAIHRVASIELAAIGENASGMTAIEAMTRLESTNKPKFFSLAASIGGTYDGLRMATFAPLAELAEELNAMHSNSPLVCSIIGLFWNQKSNTRLQYDWHQESVDYVDFDWSFHGWFPIFSDVPLERGPMVVAKGSHTQNYPYEMHRKKGGGTQLRPLIDVDSKFEAVPLPVKRGDLILFHHALVHRTGQNQTDIPRVSGILRFTPAIARDRYMPMIRYQYADEGHKERVRANAARYIED